jgi:hypothetical protein
MHLPCFFRHSSESFKKCLIQLFSQFNSPKLYFV